MSQTVPPAAPSMWQKFKSWFGQPTTRMGFAALFTIAAAHLSGHPLPPEPDAAAVLAAFGLLIGNDNTAKKAP